jgi:hypothetical protein
MLTIKGENKVEKEEEEGDYYYSERNYGHFRAYHRPAAGDRLRQRQGKVQERRSESDHSQEAGSAELAKKNRADRKLNLHASVARGSSRVAATPARRGSDLHRLNASGRRRLERFV